MTYVLEHLRRKEWKCCSGAGADHSIRCKRRRGILLVRINDVALYHKFGRQSDQYGSFS